MRSSLYQCAREIRKCSTQSVWIFANVAVETTGVVVKFTLALFRPFMLNRGHLSKLVSYGRSMVWSSTLCPEYSSSSGREESHVCCWLWQSVVLGRSISAVRVLRTQKLYPLHSADNPELSGSFFKAWSSREYVFPCFFWYQANFGLPVSFNFIFLPVLFKH